MIECSICKAHNEDRSLYCLECGQRLLPKFQDPANNLSTTADILPSIKQTPYQPSNKLHSPILDSGGPAVHYSDAASLQPGTVQPPPSGNGRISRNGLHSPLLDGKDYFPKHYPESEPNSQIPSDPANRNSDKSRLHSPVLDGPFPGANNSGYLQESYNIEGEEYESLRSPLLKSKVPLPEIQDPSVLSSPTPSGQTLQSLLGSSAGTPKTESDYGIVTSNAGHLVDPPFSVTGISKLQSQNAKKVVNEAADKKLAARTSQSLLPADDENLASTNNVSTSNTSSFGKVLVIFLIFVAIGLKSWYLISLGSNAYSSTPFILDQAGQVLVMILVIFIATILKN